MPKPLIGQDSNICFGKPRIIGTGIPVEAVVDRFMAGETIFELLGDYDIYQPQIEAAIRHQLKEDEEILDLDGLQDYVRELSESNDIWKREQSTIVNFFIVAVSGEAGELANKWKKVLRGDFELNFDEFAEEAADVLVYCLLLMSALSRGAKSSVMKKLEIVKKRVEAGGFGERPGEKGNN